ncbi:TPA: hypothetical protein KKX58_001644 [Legionella pneumophila]|nr:hypothetical protein [Legionella pneumophila]HBD7410323.1 hypothetical protein [Legionella pneumophila]HBD9405516.1 hypothetical protein [Legionella pneumophila]HBI2968745.1 hypothetical protein [Legionella pneumophila]
MNKHIFRALPLTLAGLMLSGTGFSESRESTSIMRECRSLISTLNRLVKEKPHDVCAGDIANVSNYVEKAFFQLNKGEIVLSLAFMKYAQLELADISSTRSYCTHMAIEVKPALSRIKVLGNQLEELAKSGEKLNGANSL